MSRDPSHNFPYPIHGVRYAAPPWSADFAQQSRPQNVNGRGQDARRVTAGILGQRQDESGVNSGSQPGRSRGLAHLSNEDQASIELDQATYGVELEFLVVEGVKPRRNEDGDFVTIDPRKDFSELFSSLCGGFKSRDFPFPSSLDPDDPRWLSTKISKWSIENMMSYVARGCEAEDFRYDNGTYSADDEIYGLKHVKYARTKLTRALRGNGIVVIKWPDNIINRGENFVPIPDFSDSDNSDDEREDLFSNSVFLNGFRSIYTYNPSLTENFNIAEALQRWEADWADYHTTHNLKMYRTRERDIDLSVERCSVYGWPNGTRRQLEHMQMVLRARLQRRRVETKQNREIMRNMEVDPIHVPVPGLSGQYKAWTVTVDYSVDGNGMGVHRYQNTKNSSDPFHEYYWFGAEVVSPVLALGDERARESIRLACGTIRDAFRCHKPMEVSTGLHVHLGHTKGWTLLQAKRFATLWFVAERTIFSLHRKDRGLDQKWCANMGFGSLLWKAL
ncbi:hypothetical protein O1611_g1007 [Lasiodiplodia mahajangana]|uniref:Uncharacterized protein n=1 Tax=Lasiodiplodia mahajangana TaxID=1108764 RepID=A0ACC2JZ36_9PEZI|nr:hypothetical protein O1611_g1007 [Lasiodiplodia mahajangana]